MMFNKEIIDRLTEKHTPFYYYDTAVLRATVEAAMNEASAAGFHVHYAVKANFNPVIMKIIAGYGLGADCVSGNEILHAVSCGFKPESVVFAGVGKSDEEIRVALETGIKCFNCESAQEIEVINAIAATMNKKAPVALRINPNVPAHTIRHITTGTDENKFGIRLTDLDDITALLNKSASIEFRGIHFHIGSQVTDMNVYRNLCTRVNEVYEWFADHGLEPADVNVGGGLGVDYHDPESIPQFEEYFGVFTSHLDKRIRASVSFELGRSLTANCGALISKVLYVKKGAAETFLILDAGMTDLLRPALYNAYHRIDNLTSSLRPEKYTVVGPICESTDTFGRFVVLPETQRGDLIALRSAGAYGEVMASRYNLRDLPAAITSEELGS